MGCIIKLWIENILRGIGDSLGKMIDTNKSYKQSPESIVACILVEIHLREGLSKSLNIVVGKTMNNQMTHYVNSIQMWMTYHIYGHVIEYYSQPLIRKVWQRNVT